MTGVETYAAIGAVFVCAGLVYAFAGYKAKLSKYLRGDPTVKFSATKIGKTAGLGIFLGLVAFASEELLNGDASYIDITNPGVFAKQVAATIGIIYGVDKLIIAGTDGGSRRSENVKKENTTTTTTDDTIDSAGIRELDADAGPSGVIQ